MAYSATYGELNYGENTEKKVVRFPIIMFLLALLKDFIIDPLVLIATIALPPLGWIFGIFASVFVGGIFSLWLLFKVGGFKARSLRRGAARLAPTVAIGFVPFLRFIIPEFTVLIILTYRSDKRNAKRLG